MTETSSPSQAVTLRLRPLRAVGTHPTWPTFQAPNSMPRESTVRFPAPGYLDVVTLERRRR